MRKLKKLTRNTKIVSFSLALLLTFSMMTAVLGNRQDVMNENAAGTYNAAAALDYASNHWNDGKGLCAEFVSDCLKNGGLSSYSKSATSLMNQLITNHEGTKLQLKTSGNKIKMSDNEGKVSPGVL